MATKMPPNPIIPGTKLPCSVHTGILFSRKPCPHPALVKCGNCRKPICQEHMVEQQSGPFLCSSCDAYAHDDHNDWNYDRNRDRWNYRSRGDDTRAAGTGAAAGAAAGQDTAMAPVLDGDDKSSFSAGEPGERWHGPDTDGNADAADAAGDSGGDTEMSDFDDAGDFDAS